MAEWGGQPDARACACPSSQEPNLCPPYPAQPTPAQPGAEAATRFGVKAGRRRASHLACCMQGQPAASLACAFPTATPNSKWVLETECPHPTLTPAWRQDRTSDPGQSLNLSVLRQRKAASGQSHTGGQWQKKKTGQPPPSGMFLLPLGPGRGAGSVIQSLGKKSPPPPTMT